MMAKFDVDGIQDFLKSTFIANNAADQMATPAPDYYLSTGMTKPVKQFFTVRPENIKPQANVMPCISVHYEGKIPVSSGIAINQKIAKRRCEASFVITAMIWNQNFSANIQDDPADRDMQKLMENIEELLRSHPTLGGRCLWQIPGQVSIHDANMSEKTHFSVAFMELKVTAFY